MISKLQVIEFESGLHRIELYDSEVPSFSRLAIVSESFVRYNIRCRTHLFAYIYTSIATEQLISNINLIVSVDIHNKTTKPYHTIPMTPCPDITLFIFD